MACSNSKRVSIESGRWIDLSQRVFQHVLREVDIASLMSLMGSMCVVLCIIGGHSDHYSRSGGAGTLGDVICKDSKVGPKSFVF